MNSLRTRIVLVLLALAATPVAALAADGASEETIWDWIVRLMQWAAGGWHHY